MLGYNYSNSKLYILYLKKMDIKENKKWELFIYIVNNVQFFITDKNGFFNIYI